MCSPLETITRLGFAARGILYLLIGSLALRFGSSTDGAAALDYLASGGGLLLGVMALGFAGYGLLRLAEAVFDGEGEGADAKGLAARAGTALSGAVHLGLAFYAGRIALGGRGSSGSGAEEWAATALTLPGGPILLYVAAAVLASAAVLQLVFAFRSGFRKRLRADTPDWVVQLGRAGYAARGAVLLLIAWLVFRAGRTANPEAAGGMGEALGAVTGWPQFLIAAGLIFFGLFSFGEARYRVVADPRAHVRGRAGILRT
jgi:hypothetical protein